MSQTDESSGFKYVFWGLIILTFIAFAGQGMWMFFGGVRSFVHLLGLPDHGRIVWGPNFFTPRLIASWIPLVVLPILYIGIVATAVYKDAKRRSLDPWLWATVATFVPFFLGIIVYLVVRSNGRSTCERCGRVVRSDYKLCPYCGHPRELLCPQCSKPISPSWKICPNCEYRLAAGGGAGSSLGGSPGGGSSPSHG